MMKDARHTSPLQPQLPRKPGSRLDWGRLYGSAFGLAIQAAAERHEAPAVVIAPDAPAALRLEQELRFFGGGTIPVLNFPDWETLPYDIFSPHQEIVSQRLATLYRLLTLERGILVVSAPTLMHRLPPRSYLEANALILDSGQRLDLETFRRRLETSGYQCVSQVVEPGEFAVRGSLLDLFPMGSERPFRIDLFDNEIESIRTFDPETQRTLKKVENARLLPAREFPLTPEAIQRFRQAYRTSLEGELGRSIIYQSVSDGLAPPGIEYYLPLFFEQTATLLDYLPDQSLLFLAEGSQEAMERFWQEAEQRYESRRHDVERPLLPPSSLFLRSNELLAEVGRFSQIRLHHFKQTKGIDYATAAPPDLSLAGPAGRGSEALKRWLREFPGRVLLATESTGRREALLELLKGDDIHPTLYDGWHSFLEGDAPIGVTVAPLEQGLVLEQPPLAVITEPQLFGTHAIQRSRRRTRHREAEAIIRDLAELQNGAPVVHEEHGIGRFLGLQRLAVGGTEAEFLALEYAGGDKLYVPVSSLHLISRYSGASPENAPLHKLGSGQWERARRKASEKVRDVAAELLEIYARREARKGHAYPVDDQYAAFAAAFPFEETPDQLEAIHAVLQDMASDKPMDRLVCGDVGFGKTEVAMRAAFVAVQGGSQVAVLVPTTLLAQQHYQSFRDRFADWPVNIESLSRFRSRKEQQQVLAGLENGTIDIVIGTHKLLQEGVKYKRLGLVIIDEEHRFGVRQKERFKALRSEVDILTLTATPIPRTLNMAFSGLREFSVIATAPARRLPVKTFVSEWSDTLLSEAILREIKRGGQVYFLHNKVETIDRAAARVRELVPEARVEIAHGQMGERELERVMADFYHQRFNVLVCTTIIETGIDIPSANTIIIDRADRFGLAQLYQLRGRVGRSHHRAYAYLIIPSRKQITTDALKRLEALESIEDLGAGFTLATHDLEIRGAGELLGEGQSGQMQEIGFNLYSELLERAVKALKAGQQPELDRPLDHGAEVELHLPTLLPEDYLPDVHTRLVMYKRIASARDQAALRELQVEMIDRFGLLPEAARNLFRITELKLKANPLGIRKIDVGEHGGRILFKEKPNVDPMTIIELIQKQPDRYRLDGQDKLRIVRELPDQEQRLQAVDRLLEELATKS